MRSPTWISPPFGGRVLKDDIRHGKEGDITQRQYTFSEDEKQFFHNNPDDLLQLRRKIEADLQVNFPLFTKGTELQKETHKTMLNEMLRRIGPGHEDLKVNIVFPLSSKL